MTRLHTRSRDEANDPEFCRPLADATGVWIGGGKQLALTNAYLGTEVERQLKALLDRGGVIGGTSAGAAVMTRVMIASGRTEAVLSRGFDLLPGAVIDQHFLKRNCARRLLGVVASHRDLIGFGIDEGTTLVISPRTGRLRVLGDSYVLACIADGATGGARFRIPQGRRRGRPRRTPAAGRRDRLPDRPGGIASRTRSRRANREATIDRSITDILSGLGLTSTR